VPTFAAQQIGEVDPASEVVPTENTPSVCCILDSKPDTLFLLFPLPACREVDQFAVPIGCGVVLDWGGNWD